MGCIATISALGASLYLAAAASQTEVLIGTEASFPPYISRDAVAGLQGFDVDVMGEICKRAALDCNWQTAPFSELLPGVAEGRFDLAIGGLAITQDRRRFVDFSLSYTQGGDQEYFLGHAGAPPPEAALIAVEAGSMHEDWLRQQNMRYRSYLSEPAVLEAVGKGKADLALGPYSTRLDLQPLIDAHGLESLYDVTIPDQGTGIAVCKGNSKLLQAVDMAIDAMAEDGTLERLHSRWF